MIVGGVVVVAAVGPEAVAAIGLFTADALIDVQSWEALSN